MIFNEGFNGFLKFFDRVMIVSLYLLLAEVRDPTASASSALCGLRSGRNP